MNIIERLMWAVECEMTPPPAYGIFHIILIVVGLTLCISLAWLCRKFDDKKNNEYDSGIGYLNADDSKVKIIVLPTNEELSIARETKTLTQNI